MITNRTSAIFLATLVSVAGLLWVSVPGGAKEASAATTCVGVTWPALPVACLIGGSDRRVRQVSADRTPSSEMALRFAVAFQ